MRIGTLVKISGQVVRTHPVHPELVRRPAADVNANHFKPLCSIDDDGVILTGERHLPVPGLPGDDQRRPSAVQVFAADHLQKPRLQQPRPLPPRHTQIQVHRLPEGTRRRKCVFLCMCAPVEEESDLSLCSGAYPGDAGGAAPRVNPTFPGNHPEGRGCGDSSGWRSLRLHRDPHRRSRCLSAPYTRYGFTLRCSSYSHSRLENAFLTLPDCLLCRCASRVEHPCSRRTPRLRV